MAARASCVAWRGTPSSGSGRAPAITVREPDGAVLVDTLAFDALGLGIVTSRTLVFRKGDSEARLVVSSRGRGSRR